MVIPASRTVDVEPPPLQVLPAGANQQCAGGGRAWLGLRAAQIDRLQRKEGIELSSKPFSPVDRRKVQSMLKNNQFLGETQNAEWRQELEAMQERGIKVDLEAVLELERGFEIFSEEVVQQELLSENAIA